jgi:capsular exopolysaccharide synthesis family protein
VSDSGTPRQGAGEPPPERPGGLLSKVAGHLVMYHDSQSLHAEQYRSCRANLAALNRGGGPWSVVITSSVKGEGKSITAANVAACLAEMPVARACLIDADFRSPAQAEIFGQDNTPGLSELLSGRAQQKDALRPTVISDLDLIPAGAEPRNPAELLGSEAFRELLGDLKRRYSWILIDTPPVQPYTDACVATAQCNGALLVVRMEQTDKDVVKQGQAAIQKAGGRLLGTFLTGLATDPEESDRYGHYRSTSRGREGSRQAGARERARREAERRLQQQEKAWLERKRKQERRDTEPDV